MDQSTPSLKTTIVTPLFFGEASGASVYYQLLANSLLNEGCDVSVISDREAGEFQGHYFGLFPQRCGREKKFPKDIFAYAIQNLNCFSIPKLIQYEQPDTLLIHSSFYNHPGIFANVMDRVRHRFAELRMVLDVRDRMVPQKCIKKLNIYDEIIACSENVVTDLQRKGISKNRIAYIPVLQERLSLDLSTLPGFLEDLEISQPYIYYAGLVKESKGVDLLLDAFVHYIHKQEPELSLVISGLMKTTNPRVLSLLQMEGVYYVGNRSRDEVLQLMAGASVCVNISPNEGMPRSCLEALALKRPAVLPPNIPEFEKHCPDQIISFNDPRKITKKILDTYRKASVPSYPIEKHYPEYVLPKYHEILWSSE